MHGANIVRKQDLREDGKLQVAEIFYTLQGEGPFCGLPATFIRLTGCNLRCWFCDTEWNDVSDQYMCVSDIVNKVREVTPDHCDLIVLTGGEPLRQDIAPLVQSLIGFRHDVKIQIETAGTYWQDILADKHIYVVVSPKTPKINNGIKDIAHAFKYVIQAGANSLEDGLPVVSTQTKGGQARLARPRKGAPVYLSPCDEGNSSEDNRKAVAILALQHGYRAGLQLHKIFDLR